MKGQVEAIRLVLRTLPSQSDGRRGQKGFELVSVEGRMRIRRHLDNLVGARVRILTYGPLGLLELGLLKGICRDLDTNHFNCLIEPEFSGQIEVKITWK